MSIKIPDCEEILKGIFSITQKAFSELESCYYKQVNIQDLSFTFSVSQDLDKYKSQSCQNVILSKEQQATNGNAVSWFIADVSNTPNGKNYSGNIACNHINGDKKYLWNKIKTLLTDTYYFSNDDVRTLEQKYYTLSFSFRYEDIESNVHLLQTRDSEETVM